jgi:hypothetical protein
MTDCATQHKFPQGSVNCDYDVFEEFSDGTAIWRVCVFGMGNVELKLRELSLGSQNKFLALSLQDQTEHAIRSFDRD